MTFSFKNSDHIKLNPIPHHVPKLIKDQMFTDMHLHGLAGGRFLETIKIKYSLATNSLVCMQSSQAIPVIFVQLSLLYNIIIILILWNYSNAL